MAEDQIYYRQGGQKADFPDDYGVKFDDLLQIFKIKDYFPDLDEDLLKFAFYGDGLFGAKICRVENDLLVRLQRKYALDICDNRILESHGDVILNSIVGDKVLKYFRLSISPKQYHILVRDITSNFDLTAIAYDLGVCRSLGVNSVDEVVDKHNVCANFIENLLGALFFTYGLEGTKTIQEWFFSFPIVLTIFGDNMRKAVKKYNLKEKVLFLQQGIRKIGDYFVLTDIPIVYQRLTANPDYDIDKFIDTTGYLIEEETTRDKMRLVLKDPQNRFRPLILVTRLGPSRGPESDERFGMYPYALKKLIDAGFWVVPITKDANSLRQRVNRNENF